MAYPPTEKAKEVMYAALDAFGQTYEWRKAGYMLLDGKLLDFSQDQYSRVLEHQVIYDIIGDELPKDYTPKDILMSFLNQLLTLRVISKATLLKNGITFC